MRSAWRQGDLSTLHMTGDTLEALNRSLYYSERFVHANDLKAYDTAQAALAEAVQLNTAAQKAVGNEIQQKRLSGAERLMQNYTARLGDVKNVLLASNDIREKQLNVLAPQIAT